LAPGGADDEADATARAVSLLVRAVSDVDRAELVVRVELLRLAVAALFAAAEPAGRPGPLGTGDVDDQVREFTAIAVAGLTAPAPLGPRRRRKARGGGARTGRPAREPPRSVEFGRATAHAGDRRGCRRPVRDRERPRAGAPGIRLRRGALPDRG